MAIYFFSLLVIFSLLLSNYNYNKFTVNTILFMNLISIVAFPFFYFEDLFHPFNIFFATTQFLFIYNMIDVSINKNNFRYGTLSNSFFDQAIAISILVIIIWYLFMYLGYYSGKRFKDSQIISKFNYSINNPRKIAFILIAISILSFIYVISIRGGISGMIDAMSNRVEAYAGLAYFIKLVSLGTIGSLLLLINGDTSISLLVIVITFVMLSLFGGRGAAVFSTLLPYLIVYNHNNKKIKKTILMFLGIIFGFLFIAAGNYRLYQEFRLDFTGLSDVLSTMASSSQGGEILPSLVGSLSLGKIGYGKGSTLKNILLAPIPSSLWASKPIIDESGIIGKLLINGPDKWGLPPGPYGISFYNFSYIGVVVIGFLTGLLIYKVYKQLVLNNKGFQTNSLGLIMYSIVIPALFNFISTSSQINLIWYGIIFSMLIKVDRIL